YKHAASGRPVSVPRFRRVSRLMSTCCRARILGALVTVQRGQDDVQVAVAQHLGGRIGLTISSDLLDEFVHPVEADLFLGLLAPSEAKLDADFKIVAKELDGAVALHHQVVRVNSWRELQLFHPAG